MKERIIGVLGGMGPESSAELLMRITRSTPIDVEQDHLRVIVDSNPKIPNRTDALLSGETLSLSNALAETARNLQRAGAQILGIPCNTAHAWLGDVREAIGIPVIDMIQETALQARETWGETARIGLLATDGTQKTMLYHEALAEVGLLALSPSASGDQARVMEAIQNVKLRGACEEVSRALGIVADNLAADGATALIAGCTEISLAFQRHEPDLPWLDPLQILAEELVRAARTGDPEPKR